MIKKILLLLSLVICLTSCDEVHDNLNSSPAPVITYEETTETTQATEAVYRRISAEDAKEIMESIDDYVLLDVRTNEEYNELRIEGAILIPDYELKARAATELPDKHAVILVYCRSGRRSAEAANVMVGLGYTNVYDFGGIIDWPFETINNDK